MLAAHVRNHVARPPARRAETSIAGGAGEQEGRVPWRGLFAGKSRKRIERISEIGMAVDRVRLLASVPLCLLALALALLAFDSSTPTSQGTTLSAAPTVLPFLSSF